MNPLVVRNGVIFAMAVGVLLVVLYVAFFSDPYAMPTVVRTSQGG